ncbi:P-loop containing nucleoside triphosphate hydrolase protein [Crucibulum laeve]|uniref:P-loop containing nucleoside triphosphate hydrolase protein n=1 Tax=Crucibulum laeve TaxID=68775 RepID=A0A5C3M3I0_9AGAR|nr:P-loop containing nucleoside triphosphate hydrolase protein [Crucibulum laeve]
MSAANMFEKAHDVTIRDTTINNASRDLNQYTINQPAERREPAKIILKPHSSALFTGQRAHLDKLKGYFSPRNENDISPRRSFVLYGMGGIGKTQISLKFTEEAAQQYSHIFWIDATDKDTISESLKGLSSIPEARNAAVDDNAESVLNWIGFLSKPWLLLFDNADEDPSVVEHSLPPNDTGDILITSRNPIMENVTGSGNSIPLDEMLMNDAVQLLLKRAKLQNCRTTKIEETATEIVKELCSLPLAIDQAGSFISSGHCSLSDYLELYSDEKKTLMDYTSFRGASRYARTVYGTWELSYKTIESMANDQSNKFCQAAQTAIEIHQLMAFFHHENIVEAIFSRAAERFLEFDLKKEAQRGLPLAILMLEKNKWYITENNKWDKLKFGSGIQVLISLSLIKKDPVYNIYSIHPMIHSWCRERMEAEQKCSILFWAWTILGYSAIWKDEMTDYMLKDIITTHLKKNQQYRSSLKAPDEWKDERGRNIIYPGDGQEKGGAGYRSSRYIGSHGKPGTTYRQLGRYSEAETLEIQVINKRKEVLGTDHPDTLFAMENLVATYWKLSRYSEAEALDIQVMEKRKDVLGTDHPDTLNAMVNLAATYRKLGKYSEANTLDIQVINKRK